MSKDEKIIVHSSTKNLVLIRKFIEEQALKLGFDENVINQIILAVDEACTNIMKYSHSFNEENTIQICTKLIGDDFKIQIKYNGKSFDPNNIQNPDMDEYFKSFRVGGLGIPMMKKFMNRIEYDYKIPDENSLTLIKSIS
ncbi:MAG: ATP-binding protein [Ignavibacteriaceae bacterium]|nr:MAG: ATP-binding protein [Chlorobiota bacterium]KXK01607.1 MAG: anti-sigma regulatory factor, serine/threonine protein kinase [Chlorobi bacterium OLB4]MBV6398631.1 Serine-protein kinase RsbW [Ignavibacteria bacterium]MCC6885201.1 ATP-binding protein [Ignavibacteriales bacterium]MCE7952009.1 ATP-binding protein [Chlorobi bacterium CHB7]MDL1886433.1 ATP-binding protein [Ignavibacteria bacterium CHB1]MEB2330413.1 ATP-binding protein [Ignavibacteriaceae bacterium]OQY77702.1 MAG: hypothetical 